MNFRNAILEMRLRTNTLALMGLMASLWLLTDGTAYAEGNCAGLGGVPKKVTNWSVVVAGGRYGLMGLDSNTYAFFGQRRFVLRIHIYTIAGGGVLAMAVGLGFVCLRGLRKLPADA